MNITDTTRILFILLIIVIVFSNSLQNGFVWDDKFLIINNPYIKDPAYISKIFSTQLYAGDEMESNFYRPLQLFSFMMDYSIWGLKPFGYHLTSLFLHIINTALLYMIILAINLSPFVAFITAALFGIAPAISSITFYIPARSDLLMALFIFLSILFFVRYREKGNEFFYIISVFSFAVSLLCKEMAIILPLLLVLVETFPPTRWGITPPRRWKWLLPYIVILLIYISLRISILNFAKGTNPIIDFSYPATLPLRVRLLTDFKVIFLYLRILLFPAGLHIEWFVKPLNTIFQTEALLYITAFIIMVFAIKKIASKNRFILFGGLWFLFGLLPVLNIYPISVLFGEGWLYIPSVGFFVILGSIFQDIIKPKAGKIFSGILVALFLIYYAFFTISYGKVWKDSVSVFSNVLRYEKNSPFIYLTYNNLGMAYYDKGDLKRSIEYCRKSILSKPDYFEAYNNLGVTYAVVGRPVRAIRSFKKAISLKKDYLSAYDNLAHIYNIMGLKDRAIEVLKTTIMINPHSYKAYCNLGYIYSDKGDIAKAMNFSKKACQLREEDYEAHYCLANIYMKNKNYKEALYEYNKALKLGLSNTEIYNKLGFAYIKNSRFKEAEMALIHSLALNKDQCEPYNNLGNLYSMFGHFDLAIKEYRQALKIEPNNSGIVDNIKKTKSEWKQSLRKKDSALSYKP